LETPTLEVITDLSCLR